MALPRNGKYIVYDQNEAQTFDASTIGWMKANGTSNAGYVNTTPFTTIYRIVGGMDAWKAAGYPTYSN